MATTAPSVAGLVARPRLFALLVIGSPITSFYTANAGVGDSIGHAEPVLPMGVALEAA